MTYSLRYGIGSWGRFGGHTRVNDAGGAFDGLSTMSVVGTIRRDRSIDGDTRSIIGKTQVTADVLSYSWLVQTHGPSDQQIKLTVADALTGSTYLYTATVDAVLLPGVTTRFAITFDHGSVLIYTQGTSRTVTTLGPLPTSLLASSLPLFFGINGDDGSQQTIETGFCGDWSQMAIYDRVLSAAEVAADYSDHTLPTGPLGYWAAQEGSGSTVVDTVSARNGTIVNDACWTNLTEDSSHFRVMLAGGVEMVGYTGDDGGVPAAHLDFRGMRYAIATGIAADETVGSVQIVGTYSLGYFLENRFVGENPTTIAQLAALLFGNGIAQSNTEGHAVANLLPNVVVSTIGLEDVTSDPATAVASYQSTIIAPLQALGIQVVVVNLPPTSNGTYGPLITAFNAALASVDDPTNGVRLVDVVTGYDDAWHYNAKYPDQSGLDFMASKILPALRTAILALTRRAPDGLRGPLATTTRPTTTSTRTKVAA